MVIYSQHATLRKTSTVPTATKGRTAWRDFLKYRDHQHVNINVLDATSPETRVWRQTDLMTKMDTHARETRSIRPFSPP